MRQYKIVSIQMFLVMSAAAATLFSSVADGSAATRESTGVVWSMSPRGGVVTDPAFSLSLELTGRWADDDGWVRFGGSGVPSLGVSHDGARLAPNDSDFAVAARVTSAKVPVDRGYSPNIVQKGLAGQGGQWKMTLRPTSRGARGLCRFEGARGRTTISDATSVVIDDGRHHDIECWREGVRIGITVDGHTTSAVRAVGAIRPSTPTTVANKKINAGVKDQFNGSIGCVVVMIGQGSRGAGLAHLGC